MILTHCDQPFWIAIVYNNDTYEYHFFNNSFNLHRLYYTYFNFSPSSSHYVETTSIFTRFIVPIVHKERQRSKTKVQQENNTGAISRISEIDTSSPATLCSDSTATADQYEKIARLIIPHEVLKNVGYISHVCKQVTIWQESHQTKIDPEKENIKEEGNPSTISLYT